MNSPRWSWQVLAFGDGVNTGWFGQGAHLVLQCGSDSGDLEDWKRTVDNMITIQVDMSAQNLKIA